MAKKKSSPKDSQTPRRVEKSSIGHVLFQSALEIAKKCSLQTLLLYVDGLNRLDELDTIDFSGAIKIILVTREDRAFEKAQSYTKNVVRLPSVQLTRMGQIKMAIMLSFSKRLLNPQDRFVYVTGLDQGHLDTMMVMEVGQEYEVFHSINQPPLTEHIRRGTFERILNLALELASEGREGKPIGAIFVLGNTDEISRHVQQNIINPFRGHPENERNILDDKMSETVKEFASIDGAFVIKGNGVIVSAGTYLLPKLVAEELPQGLGARHAAAAAITAATKSIAITISESTGTVRIWRQGRLITEIEKAKPPSRSTSMAPDTPTE